MTLAVDDDFARFVAARWGELEPVAYVVTLDEASARRLTAAALAELHDTWDDVVDHGSPTRAARGAVLATALRGAPGLRGAGRGEPVLDARPGWAAEPAGNEETVAAVLTVLVGASPLERAALAARVVWGVEAAEAADLLGMPSAHLLAARSALQGRLVAAHTAARASSGSAPDEWAMERDVEDAVELLLRDHDHPPDPTELVGERRRQVRRRSLVVGGAATLAVGTVAAWGGNAVLGGAASGGPVTTPGPGDPAWRTTSTWPARGSLANDPEVLGVVRAQAPTAHVLFADDLPGRRVVVASAFEPSGGLGTTVRLWTGPGGGVSGALTEAALVRDRITFLTDVVPVVVPAADRAGLPDLLLLGRPHVLTAEYSTRVTYASTGEAMRTWTEVPLDSGTARVPLSTPVPPALRVRLGGYDGGPVGTSPLGLGRPDPTGPVAASLLEAVGPFVSAVTGLRPSRLRSRVVLEAAVPGDVFVPARDGTTAAGLAAVVITHLPGGARLRSVRVAGDGRGEVGPADLETARGIPAEDEGAPFAVRLPWFRSTTGRFLVLAPGAARAQLTAVASNVYPASPVTELTGGTGVLEVVNARLASVYRLVLWSATGRRLGGWRQVFRRGDPRDLWTAPR